MAAKKKLNMDRTIRIWITLIWMSGLILTGTKVTQAAPNACQGNSIQIPYDCNDLQAAINGVNDGGTLELYTGTYTAPSPNGWGINEQFKSITFKAMPGQTVVFSGNGSTPILEIMNTSYRANYKITFTGITFRNGYSNVGGLAGGVSVYKGLVEFINCRFENNYYQNVGGALIITQNSLAYITNTTFEGNWAKSGGGAIEINENATVYINGSTFTGNRTNKPGHADFSAGGAIHAGNSNLYISDTSFTDNQAGYVGGAVYSIADWYQAREVIIHSSIFTNNRAWPDPSVTLSVPTEGGGFHTESNVTGSVYDSQFINNTAMNGGAITMYRSVIRVYNSIFRGNTSPGTSFQGCGGSISGVSNDTVVDGANNYRTSSLSVYGSLFQGHYGTATGDMGTCGGAIYMGGDVNRLYGSNGVGQMGNAATNRALLTIDNSAFYDFQMAEYSPYPASGGVVMGDLADITITDSYLLKGKVRGAAMGGGLSAINQSSCDVADSVLSDNTSELYGGAVFGHGSQLNITTSILADNVLTHPGSGPSSSYGAAIFTTILPSPPINMTGTISDSIISNSTGLPIFDDDRNYNLGPINDMRYNRNQIQGTTFGTAIYTDSAGYSGKTVSELNSLVVVRNQAGISTDKSLINNTALSSPAVYAVMKVFWPQLDPLAGRNKAFLVYAWGGDSATLNGNSLSSKTGLVEIYSPGTYILRAGNKEVSVVVTRLNPMVYLPMVLH